MRAETLGGWVPRAGDEQAWHNLASWFPKIAVHWALTLSPFGPAGPGTPIGPGVPWGGERKQR